MSRRRTLAEVKVYSERDDDALSALSERVRHGVDRSVRA